MLFASLRRWPLPLGWPAHAIRREASCRRDRASGAGFVVYRARGLIHLADCSGANCFTPPHAIRPLDPFYPGHLRMFTRCARFGGKCFTKLGPSHSGPSRDAAGVSRSVFWLAARRACAAAGAGAKRETTRFRQCLAFLRLERCLTRPAAAVIAARRAAALSDRTLPRDRPPQARYGGDKRLDRCSSPDNRAIRFWFTRGTARPCSSATARMAEGAWMARMSRKSTGFPRGVRQFGRGDCAIDLFTHCTLLLC